MELNCYLNFVTNLQNATTSRYYMVTVLFKDLITKKKSSFYRSISHKNVIVFLISMTCLKCNFPLIFAFPVLLYSSSSGRFGNKSVDGIVQFDELFRKPFVRSNRSVLTNGFDRDLNCHLSLQDQIRNYN